MMINLWDAIAENSPHILALLAVNEAITVYQEQKGTENFNAQQWAKFEIAMDKLSRLDQSSDEN